MTKWCKLILIFLMTCSCKDSGPLEVTLGIIGPKIQSATRKIVVTSTPETFTDATIEVTDEGFLDDSVFGIKHTLKFIKRKTWHLKSHQKLFKCRYNLQYQKKTCP